jgi:glucose-1-phosphate cytidylyltransferase
MRLREYSERIPKPLAEVGPRPLLWHLMKYYSHFGYSDFVLCLGYGADAIKTYFAEYKEYLSNDFTLTDGGKTFELHGRDIKNWRITFVDTGLHANLGQRLLAVRDYVAGEEVFLANYADGLSDLNCKEYVDNFIQRNKVASFISVAVPQTYHIVHADAEGFATKLEHVAESATRVNGGFFAFQQRIFDYIKPGEELVVEPFARLITERQLMAIPFNGFWRSMDTFKDKIELDELVTKGLAPWQVWRQAPRKPA